MRIRLTRDSKRVLDEWGARLGTVRPKRKIILNGLIHAYSYQGDRICSQGTIDFSERQPIPTDKEFTLSKEIEQTLDGLLKVVLQTFEHKIARKITHGELANQLIMLSRRDQDLCWKPLRDFVLSGVKEDPRQIFLELSDQDLEQASAVAKSAKPNASTADTIAKRLDDYVAGTDASGLREVFQRSARNLTEAGHLRIVVLSVREETKQRLSTAFDSDFESAVTFLVRRQVLAILN